MRALIQRVANASVSIEGRKVGNINNGLLILLGIENGDEQEDIDWLVHKLGNLRIFPDEENVMNISITDCNGEFLVISQFTLHASVKKGNRPSYIKAAKPEVAIPLYEGFIKKLNKKTGLKVETGIFGADMKVALVNDGPVTIFIDSKNKE